MARSGRLARDQKWPVWRKRSPAGLSTLDTNGFLRPKAAGKQGTAGRPAAADGAR